MTRCLPSSTKLRTLTPRLRTGGARVVEEVSTEWPVMRRWQNANNSLSVDSYYPDTKADNVN